MAHLRTASDRYIVGGAGSTGTGAIWTPIAINATGYDKALACIVRGAEAGGTKGTVTGSVYESATSGGTYALRTGSLGTSGTSSTATCLLIEIAVAAATPFLKIYGTASTTGTGAIPVAAVAELYRGSRILPPSADITVVSA
jgi:hypothetical protein